MNLRNRTHPGWFMWHAGKVGRSFVTSFDMSNIRYKKWWNRPIRSVRHTRSLMDVTPYCNWDWKAWEYYYLVSDTRWSARRSKDWHGWTMFRPDQYNHCLDAWQDSGYCKFRSRSRCVMKANVYSECDVKYVQEESNDIICVTKPSLQRDPE